MFRFAKIASYALTGALGGSAAWAFVLTLASRTGGGLLGESLLGGLVGLCIGGFLWSHESISGRRFKAAAKQAGLGAVSGLIGGAVGALLGNTTFTALGKEIVDAGGFNASLGVLLAVALGWSILGAIIGLAGGLMIRSRERAWYGFFGGGLGGMVGGVLFSILSSTSIWSDLAGLCLLGMSIGAFISSVEEAFVSAKVKVVKGRHLGREFPILKTTNLIGRDDRSDICLSGAEGVGLQHATIKRAKGGYAIETEKDGAVYVNQKLTRNSRLSDGDVIRVGSILLLFSAVKKAAAGVAVALLIFGATLAILPIPEACAADAATVRISQFDLTAYPEVKAYVSVLDAAGRPILGLTQANVTLRENGRPVTVDSLGRSDAQGKQEPVSFSIVLDRSRSMKGEKIAQAKASVLSFLSLMGPGDRASLITFSDRVTRVDPLTNDVARLKEDAEKVVAGGHTALFDAIAAGVASVQGVPGRRAVIVLTDGMANRGAIAMKEAIAAAIRENVSVSVIGLGADVRAARLEGIAAQSGGEYFFAPAADRLAEIYQTIGRRIHGEYVVTYRTEARGNYLRTLSLSLTGGIEAVRAYFQPQSSLFGAAGPAPGWAYSVSLASFLALMGLSFPKIEQHYRTAHLSLVRGRGNRKELDIGTKVVIGKDEQSGLGLFRDDAIEGQHAEIRNVDGNYVLEDKGSLAGTFVNQEKVAGTQVLQDGDVITLGKTTIVFSNGTVRTCAGCGNPLGAKARFCVHCGLQAA